MSGFHREAVGQAFRDAFLSQLATGGDEIHVGDQKLTALCEVTGPTQWHFQFAENPNLKVEDTILHVATSQEFSVIDMRQEYTGSTKTHYDVVGRLIAEKKVSPSKPAASS